MVFVVTIPMHFKLNAESVKDAGISYVYYCIIGDTLAVLTLTTQPFFILVCRIVYHIEKNKCIYQLWKLCAV